MELYMGCHLNSCNRIERLFQDTGIVAVMYTKQLVISWQLVQSSTESTVTTCTDHYYSRWVTLLQRF